MSRTVNGVKHDKGCACPFCDPQQKLLARRRDEARAARAFAAANPALPLAVDRPRTAPSRGGHVFESAKDRRFKELLRAGIGYSRAAAQVEAEFTNQEGDHHDHT
jgi:hypothetical protein